MRCRCLYAFLSKLKGRLRLVGGRRWQLARPSGKAALTLIERARGSPRRITLAADKAYDVADFVAALRALSVTLHHRHRWTRARNRQAAQDVSRSTDHAPCRLRDQPASC